MPAPPELDCRVCPNSKYSLSQNLGRAFFDSRGVGEEVHRDIPGFIGLLAWKLRALCCAPTCLPP